VKELKDPYLHLIAKVLSVESGEGIESSLCRSLTSSGALGSGIR